MTMMATCYNIKRLAGFLKDGVDTFYKATSPNPSKGASKNLPQRPHRHPTGPTIAT